MTALAQTLVLSLFSGVGSLDEGFRRAGYCCVSAGDVCWGSFYDMTPELRRVIEEAQPRWFLRENVPRAPEIKPAGYTVATFLLDHSTMDSGDGTGHEQRRRRRFWFGVQGDTVPELRGAIDFALTVLPKPALPVAAWHDKLDGAERIAARRQTVTGRNPGEIGLTGGHRGSPPRYTLDEMLDLQGLPRDLFEHSPMTAQGKRKLIGNAVPLPMSEALGRAVREVMR